MENLVLTHKPLFNTPVYIVEHWKAHIDKNMIDNPEAKGIKFDEGRYLRNCKFEIQIYGCSLVTDTEGNNHIYLALVGEGADTIDAVMVADAEEGEDMLQYHALYDSVAKDKDLATKPQLQYMQQPTTGVGAIVWYQSEDGIELLLGRRVKGTFEYVNKLSNFGGAVELGESLWESLQRELKEEINLDLGDTPSKPVSYDTTIARYESGELYHAFSTTFAIEVRDKSMVRDMEPEKTRNFGWYKLSQLQQFPEDLTPLCRTALADWLGDLG